MASKIESTSCGGENQVKEVEEGEEVEEVDEKFGARVPIDV
jgi:hypothetical protein